MFQSTHPHGVRQLTIKNSDYDKTFQSTHPHGVRLALHLLYVWVRFVSIHAPTRGATRAAGIHDAGESGFNPRTHTGCDNLNLESGGTFPFQSTHPHGVRHILLHGASSSSKFQSTHPHGVRRYIPLLLHQEVSCFNPRTHTGCDSPHTNMVVIIYCFNPRTHTGCDFTALA